MSAETPEANRLESLLLNLIFAAATAFLLAAIFTATRSGSTTAGWWTRPALAPGVALTLLMVSNAITLLRCFAGFRAAPPTPEEWREARAKVAAWGKPVEFLIYFAVYLWAVHWAGYAIATLLFVFGLMLRVGLRSPGWLLAGLGLNVALILIFRVGLGVWMPAPDFYDRFPDAVRLTLIRWF